MPAPAIVAFVAFLTGGGLTAAVSSGEGAAAIDAIKDEAVVAQIYADLPAICAKAQPPLDALAALNPKAKQLRRIAAVTDAICIAAKRPDNPLSQALVILDAIRAIDVVNAQMSPAPIPETLPFMRAPQHRGQR